MPDAPILTDSTARGGVYIIEFIGRVVAKKNKKRQFISKRTGKQVTTYGAATEDLNNLGRQVPPYLLDLGLVHPDIAFEFYSTTGAVDRDNSITTILDVLVKYGVLINDSIAQNNGRWITETAIRSDIDRMVVRLTDHGKDLWPKKKSSERQPRR